MCILAFFFFVVFSWHYRYLFSRKLQKNTFLILPKLTYSPQLHKHFSHTHIHTHTCLFVSWAYYHDLTEYSKKKIFSVEMQNETHSTLCRPTHLQKKTIQNECNRWEFISTRSYSSFFKLLVICRCVCLYVSVFI